jgi:hypothetical protein
VDRKRCDDLLRALHLRAVSRRRIAITALAASGAAVLRGFNTTAARRRKPVRCHGDSCDGTGGKRCGKTDRCQCYRAAEGGHVCASSLQSSCDKTCRKDRDCPRRHVCVEGGPACCGAGERFCKRACRR